MSEAEQLLDKVTALSPADQLRLAAELLEVKRPRLAFAIVARVDSELRLLHLAGKL